MAYTLLVKIVRQFEHYFAHLVEKQRDPHVEIAQLLNQIEHFPTVHHQHLLVQRLIEIEAYEEALERINRILTNQFAQCPQLLLDKARILLSLGQVLEAKTVLEQLLAQKGTFLNME